MAAIFSAAYLGDALEPRHWLGMATTVVGVAWVVLERPNGASWPCSAVEWKRGIALAVVAAVACAAGIVLSKQGLGDYDAGAATFIRILGGIAGYVILVTLLRQWNVMAAAARQGPAMRIVLFGSFVGPFLGVVLAQIALRHCHAGVAATIFSTTPVLILPFAVLLHGEKLTVRAAAGAAISVAGVALLM